MCQDLARLDVSDIRCGISHARSDVKDVQPDNGHSSRTLMSNVEKRAKTQDFQVFFRECGAVERQSTLIDVAFITS